MEHGYLTSKGIPSPTTLTENVYGRWPDIETYYGVPFGPGEFGKATPSGDYSDAGEFSFYKPSNPPVYGDIYEPGRLGNLGSSQGNDPGFGDFLAKTAFNTMFGGITGLGTSALMGSIGISNPFSGLSSSIGDIFSSGSQGGNMFDAVDWGTFDWSEAGFGDVGGGVLPSTDWGTFDWSEAGYGNTWDSPTFQGMPESSYNSPFGYGGNVEPGASSTGGFNMDYTGGSTRGGVFGTGIPASDLFKGGVSLAKYLAEKGAYEKAAEASMTTNDPKRKFAQNKLMEWYNNPTATAANDPGIAALGQIADARYAKAGFGGTEVDKYLQSVSNYITNEKNTLSGIGGFTTPTSEMTGRLFGASASSGASAWNPFIAFLNTKTGESVVNKVGTAIEKTVSSWFI